MNGPSISFAIPFGSRALWHNLPSLAALKHRGEILAAVEMDKEKLAALVLKSDGDKSSDEFVEAQIYPPITLKCFKRIVYDPKLTRPIRAKGLVGKSAALSRRLLARYLKSLDGDVAIEIRSK